MSATIDNNNAVFKTSPSMWAISALIVGAMIWIFSADLHFLVLKWDSVEEFSYGYLIPVVVLFLLWQKKDILSRMAFDGSWLGVSVIVLGIFLFVAGQLSTIQVIVQYAFLVVLYGVILALVGIRGFKVILVPLLILVFMIPIPQFLFAQLSAQFQLISSEIGVALIRMFGISVFLEGNVIDMGIYKLQVVEACSGLRYLFPLMVFGFILAYFYKSSWWKRAIIFFSTIPITILMNSLRIGIIGVTVEYWGEQMAEGVLHDFEGWVIFMVCTLVLAGEMWLLTRIGSDNRPLNQVFGLEMPKPAPKGIATTRRDTPRPFIAAIAAVAILAGLSASMDEREEIIPERETFATFPLQFDQWQGRSDRLEQIYIDALKFTDYSIINYLDSEKRITNFYVAYYDSQKTGESAHSPRSCLPGGGWKISSLSDQHIDGANIDGKALVVNRAIIEMGDKKQVVYYWFQQRGRVITNEYAVKWYLFWDALTRNRTDGALVRITTYLDAGENIAAADARLSSFVKSISPHLTNYIPS